jgi:hypothetical protein
MRMSSKCDPMTASMPIRASRAPSPLARPERTISDASKPRSRSSFQSRASSSGLGWRLKST